jgi:hypothetical protein
MGGFPWQRIACPPLTKRGIKGVSPPRLKGPPPGPAFWLPLALSLSFVRTWPA